MKGHRTCIICLPRSGSQLCETLTAEVQNALKLGEYFENWNRSKYALDDNNNLYIKEIVEIKSKLMLRKDSEELLTLLKESNPSQALTLRIFLMDYYNKGLLSKIIKDLESIGFEFVVLHRDLKDQLLSFMITLAYFNFKNKNVFGINSEIQEPIMINFDKLGGMLEDLRNSSINWNNNLPVIFNNIPYQKIKYETIYNEMEKIYNTKFKYLGKKSIQGNPLDLILNKEEVINFISQ